MNSFTKNGEMLRSQIFTNLLKKLILPMKELLKMVNLMKMNGIF